MPQLHINNNHTLYILTGSLLFLTSGFLVLSFLSPFAVDNSYAQSTNVDVSVGIAPVISISTDVNSVNLDVKPNDFGSIVSGDVSVNVGTNNASGYTLSLSSSSDETALLKDGTNTNISIPTLESPTAKSTWQASDNLSNKWGFTHDNTPLLTTDTYLPIPASNLSHDTTIKTTTTPATTSNTKVTFAAKIDNTQPAGTYTNTVILSAIANNNPNLYMQDFTAEQCNALDEWSYNTATSTLHEGDTITLWDRRDGNSYKIRKLADGNCWMITNLMLEDYTLTPADSNVTNSVTIPPATDVGTTSPTSFTSITVGKDSTHLNYGYYYSWPAAVAGVAISSSEETTVNTSICPKGWRLPIGSSSATENEWFKLGQTQYKMYQGGNGQTLQSQAAALNLIFAGYRYNGNLNTSEQDDVGYYWTSTTKDATTAYAPYTTKWGYVDWTNFNYKHTGFSIRCLLSAE